MRITAMVGWGAVVVAGGCGRLDFGAPVDAPHGGARGGDAGSGDASVRDSSPGDAALVPWSVALSGGGAVSTLGFATPLAIGDLVVFGAVTTNAVATLSVTDNGDSGGNAWSSPPNGRCVDDAASLGGYLAYTVITAPNTTQIAFAGDTSPQTFVLVYAGSWADARLLSSAVANDAVTMTTTFASVPIETAAPDALMATLEVTDSSSIATSLGSDALFAGPSSLGFLLGANVDNDAPAGDYAPTWTVAGGTTTGCSVSAVFAQQ